MSDSATLWTVSSVHGDSPGKNTGVGCHALLQGIYPTQGPNPRLLHLLHWQVSSLPYPHPNDLQLSKDEVEVPRQCVIHMCDVVGDILGRCFLWTATWNFSEFSLFQSRAESHTHAEKQKNRPSLVQSAFLLFKIYFLFVCLCLSALCPHCCAWAFSSCGKQGPLCCREQASHCSGFSLAWSTDSRAHRLSVLTARGLSSHGAWA